MLVYVCVCMCGMCIEIALMKPSRPSKKTSHWQLVFSIHRSPRCMHENRGPQVVEALHVGFMVVHVVSEESILASVYAHCVCFGLRSNCESSLHCEASE